MDELLVEEVDQDVVLEVGQSYQHIFYLSINISNPFHIRFHLSRTQNNRGYSIKQV